MTHRQLPVAARAAAVLVLTLAASTGAWRLARRPVAALAVPVLEHGPRGLDAVPFGDALAGVGATVLLGCVLWLLVTVLVAVLVTVTASAGQGLAPWSARICTHALAATERFSPVLVRRLVTAALGVAVTVGSGAAPAHAGASGADGLTGVELPDRTTGSVVAVTAPVPMPPSGAVVVRPGDSLWSICAGLLGRSATDADITEAWHRLHHANVARIGADPDLILPGTRLVVPIMSAHLADPSLREGAP